MDIQSKSTLITGGASGIGRLMAIQMAKQGSRVILWDINESSMRAVAQEIQSAGGVGGPQAAELLPLWQIIQSSSRAADAEAMVVLKQIEDSMDEEQLAASDSMGLAHEDTREWMVPQGIEMPEASSPGGGPDVPQNLSQKELTAMRREPQNLRPEQRAALMAGLGSYLRQRASLKGNSDRYLG